MAIYKYDSEEELDEAFDKIEKLNMEHSILKEEVEGAECRIDDAKCDLTTAIENLIHSRKELKEFEIELQKFENEHRESLIC